jgi:hypothetical protein
MKVYQVFFMHIIKEFSMDKVIRTTAQGVNTSELFQIKISFIKSFPKDKPVYILCSYPNHGTVDMLVIPEYYSFEKLNCTLLAINPPFIPDNHAPKGSWDTITLSIEQIIAWNLWNRKDALNNFETGCITEKYLSILLN